jgi:flagellar biosynthesis protein FlgN
LTVGDPKARFVADLHAEAQAFSAFLELLRTEQAALEARDVDAVLQLAQTKAERVGVLNDLARRRGNYLTGQSFTPDRNGMAQWLLAYAGPDQASLTGVWQALLATAGAAQAVNRENGLLIETRLQHNQRLLGALASGNQPSLYGPDGQTRIGGTGRDLGKV